MESLSTQTSRGAHDAGAGRHALDAVLPVPEVGEVEEGPPLLAARLPGVQATLLQPYPPVGRDSGSTDMRELLLVF